MKKLLLGTLLLLSISMFSQDRENREKLKFIDKSEVMKDAIGWSYNTTLGEWVDYKNVISYDKDFKVKYKSLQGNYMMSQTSQSFIDIQTMTIIFKNTKYYVLLINKSCGSYKYPNIQEDWEVYFTTFGYIFTEEEFSKLTNFENELNIKSKYLVKMGTSYENYDETVFLDKLQTILNDNSYVTYIFPIRKIKNDIRFYLPDYKKYDFEKSYFETSIQNFNKIIIK